MRKIKNIVIIFFFGVLTSCGQNKKASIEIKKLPNNFLNSAGNISANTKGIIHLDAEYSVKNNKTGNADIYLIHKKGGDWWIEQAKKNFPKSIVSRNRYAKQIIAQDSKALNDYNKWAFFIDKKYLETKSESAEGGEFTSHYPKKNSEITVVLFEQKAGDTEWVAIDSVTYNTDSNGNEVETRDKKGSYYLSSEWKINFIEEKIKESNK
ncbi:hypothetical protein PP180_09760 [Muricauda sp. SK9]|uniref:hypothetical protein n=1 Tax=Flavobacteriaceae TaxID=49546 RepID=UPI0023497D32|nr:hypothetical protein [Muricauda sp. SK9]MDC6385655.1 hypothetical protein [Muricauda sp. SK9]